MDILVDRQSELHVLRGLASHLELIFIVAIARVLLLIGLDCQSLFVEFGLGLAYLSLLDELFCLLLVPLCLFF